MICPSCGRDNVDDARFCSNCGTDLGARTPPPPPPDQADTFAMPPARPALDLGRVAGAGWAQALRLGAWAFVGVALVGQILAWILFAATHVAEDTSPLGVVNALRIGGFYFFAFHHVGISFTGNVASPAVPGGRLAAGAGFAVALLLVTGMAAFLLYRFGRRVANEVGGSVWERGVHGMKVALPYALFSVILSFVLPFSIPTGPGQPSVHVGVGHVGAFVLPLLLGLFAGALGGLLSAREEVERLPGGTRSLASVVSGWRMFLAALVFAFVALLVMAAINPSLTSTVIRGESDSNGGYGATMANHILALPNQSMWLLVPAMGGCDGVYAAGGPASFKFDFLCYGRFPRTDRTTRLSPGGSTFFGISTTQLGGGLTLPFGFGTAPLVYFLFLLVPAAAVLRGGDRAATRVRAVSRIDGLVAGALAGVVFAALIAVASWLAGVGASAGGGLFGLDFRVAGSIGPRIGSGILFGLLWGVVGGAAGGALRARTEGPTPVAQEPSLPPLP